MSSRPTVDFLNEPLLTVSTRTGRERVSIPALLARWGHEREGDLAFVQVHQEHAVYAFFVQLSTIALARANLTEVALDAARWTECLLALTDGAREPYCLVVPDLEKPALLQPPVSERSIATWPTVRAADEIDVLLTAKNHDVKKARMVRATPEQWLFSLVSLQTMQGYSGRDNYGIARMNGGYGNRPALACAPAPSMAARFARDVGVLLEARAEIIARHGYDPAGLALLWLEPWDGKRSLPLSACDPFFIEICRRVRLEREGERIVARTTPTKVPRLDAKERKGNVGDVWIPTKRDDEGAALTLGGSGFHYQILSELLFGGSYHRPPALELRDDDGEHPVVIARALVRGQGVTEGFHERLVPIPREHLSLFRSPEGLARLAELAKARIQTAGNFRRELLRGAILALLQGGADKLKFDDDRDKPFLDQAERQIDARFFDAVFRDVEADPLEATARWERDLYEIGRAVLESAIASAPIPVARRPRAIAAAERRYHGGARTVLPNAFRAEQSSTQETSA